MRPFVNPFIYIYLRPLAESFLILGAVAGFILLVEKLEAFLRRKL